MVADFDELNKDIYEHLMPMSNGMSILCPVPWSRLAQLYSVVPETPRRH